MCKVGRSYLEPHEDFIRLHIVDHITTDTIVHVLKDTVLHMNMNLNMSMCRAQCVTLLPVSRENNSYNNLIQSESTK